MGHREDLLAGAKRCLYERGYARTTARDIVAASGTNLGSIGYHFGSTEALLNEAMFEAIGEWGKELERTLTFDETANAGSVERFEAYWTRVIESFTAQRQLWVASIEALAQIDRVPQVRPLLAGGIEEGRSAWASLLSNIDAVANEQQARAVGSFHQALLTGVMVQWLIDPAHAPSSHDLAEALRIIARGFQSAEAPATNKTAQPIVTPSDA